MVSAKSLLTVALDCLKDWICGAFLAKLKRCKANELRMELNAPLSRASNSLDESWLTPRQADQASLHLFALL